MQATNAIAAFYHLDLSNVNSNANSDLKNTSSMISPPMQQFDVLFQEPHALPLIRSTTHHIHLVLMLALLTSALSISIFKNVK